jgi:hypothetical protein
MQAPDGLRARLAKVVRTAVAGRKLIEAIFLTIKNQYFMSNYADVRRVVAVNGPSSRQFPTENHGITGAVEKSFHSSLEGKPF